LTVGFDLRVVFYFIVDFALRVEVDLIVDFDLGAGFDIEVSFDLRVSLVHLALELILTSTWTLWER